MALDSKQMVAVGLRQWPTDTLPLVSVLVITYNQERLIARCLDSVLAQVTNFPVEVLVHDDASSDGTVAVLRDYSSRYPDIIRLVLQTENQYSQGRKIKPSLHSLVRGRYIAYCDGDDYWLNPAKLDRQVAFLADHPDYVLSFHDAIIVDADGELIRSSYLRRPRDRRDYDADELRVLKRSGHMLFGTVMHRNVGLVFPPEYYLVRNGDHFMPRLLATHGGAKFQPDAGPLAYRHHAGGSWSSSGKSQRLRRHLQTYLQIANYFVRIGDDRAAVAIISGPLRKHIDKYEDQAKYGQSVFGRTRRLFARLRRWVAGR